MTEMTKMTLNGQYRKRASGGQPLFIRYVSLDRLVITVACLMCLGRLVKAFACPKVDFDI